MCWLLYLQGIRLHGGKDVGYYESVGEYMAGRIHEGTKNRRENNNRG